MKDIDKNRLSR